MQLVLSALAKMSSEVSRLGPERLISVLYFSIRLGAKCVAIDLDSCNGVSVIRGPKKAEAIEASAA